MNITADLKAFFSFKNHGPKSKKDFYWNYNLSLDDQDDEDYLYEVHTPMVNHALGYYLIVLGTYFKTYLYFKLTLGIFSDCIRGSQRIFLNGQSFVTQKNASHQCTIRSIIHIGYIAYSLSTSYDHRHLIWS